MKKWLYGLLLLILTVGLVACNDTEKPVEDASAEENNQAESENNNENDEEVVEEEEEEANSELTAEDIYEKALEAADHLESATVDMNIEQEITSPDGEGSLVSMIEGTTDLTVDPLTLHQNMVTHIRADDEVMESSMEMYATDEALYLFEEQLDEWIKVDTGMMGDLGELANQEDPADQLKMFQQFASEFEFEQTDDEFILKINADGDEFTSIMEQMVGDTMPPELMEGMAEEGIDLFEQMAINHMSYEMYLDKETFDLSHFKMEMDMDLEVDGETGSISQVIEATYSNVNQIDPIEVPQEVEEAALDESELGL